MSISSRLDKLSSSLLSSRKASAAAASSDKDAAAPRNGAGSEATFRKVETKKERRERINAACKQKRKRKKTRSRQKNIKKDNRANGKKPTFLTPGAVDYDPNAPRVSGEKRARNGGIRVDRKGAETAAAAEASTSKHPSPKKKQKKAAVRAPRKSHVPEAPDSDPKEWAKIVDKTSGGNNKVEWASSWT